LEGKNIILLIVYKDSELQGLSQGGEMLGAGGWMLDAGCWLLVSGHP